MIRILFKIHSTIRNILLKRWNAVLFMFALVGCCIIGLSVPQEGNVSDVFLRRWGSEHQMAESMIQLFQLHHVYTSFVFYVIVILIWLSLFYALLTLVKSKNKQPDEKIRTIGWMISKNYFTRGSLFRQIFVNAAQSKGYRVNKNTLDGTTLSKHRFSRWGSIIFHLGLIVVMTAAYLSFLTHGRGFVQVMEGDTFFGNNPEFLTSEKGAFIEKYLPPCAVSVERIYPSYYKKGGLQSLESDIHIYTNDSARVPYRLGINKPYDFSTTRIYQSNFSGYAVGMQMIKDGEVIPSWFYLDAGRSPDDKNTCVSDLPLTQYDIHLTLDGDLPSIQNNKPGSKALHCTLVNTKGNVIDATLRLGESVNIDGAILRFVDTRRWTGLIFAEQRFVAVIYLGFVLSLIGLCFIYVFPYREISIVQEVVDGGHYFRAGGSSKREPSIWSNEFEEIWNIAIEHSSELIGEPTNVYA